MRLVSAGGRVWELTWGRSINIVHPVPTYDNATALELALDRMEELGLWLMYDMRWVRLAFRALEAA